MRNNIALLVLVISVISISVHKGIIQTANADSTNISIKLEQCHNGNPISVDCDEPIGKENN